MRLPCVVSLVGSRCLRWAHPWLVRLRRSSYPTTENMLLLAWSRDLRERAIDTCEQSLAVQAQAQQALDLCREPEWRWGLEGVTP
jgi:hypothetical protein